MTLPPPGPAGGGRGEAVAVRAGPAVGPRPCPVLPGLQTTLLPESQPCPHPGLLTRPCPDPDLRHRPCPRPTPDPAGPRLYLTGHPALPRTPPCLDPAQTPTPAYTLALQGAATLPASRPCPTLSGPVLPAAQPAASSGKMAAYDRRARQGSEAAAGRRGESGGRKRGPWTWPPAALTCQRLRRPAADRRSPGARRPRHTRTGREGGAGARARPARASGGGRRGAG